MAALSDVGVIQRLKPAASTNACGVGNTIEKPLFLDIQSAFCIYETARQLVCLTCAER